MGLTAQSIHQAYSNLGEEDQRLLWATLLGIDTGSDELRLAKALRRLQIVVTNQSIPEDNQNEDGLL